MSAGRGRSLVRVPKSSLVETLGLRNMEHNEQVFRRAASENVIVGSASGSNVVYSSNPFDLVDIQNEQVLAGVTGPLCYLSRDDMRSKLGGGPSVADTLAALSSEELSEVAFLQMGSEEEFLEDAAQKAPIVRLVDAIIREAHRLRTSDIHLEPTQTGVSLRYRIDGVLYERPSPPLFLFPAVISRIKILAALNIAEKRLPQDGRFRFNVDGSELDIRVAVMPSIYGESASLRLLDKSIRLRSLPELGLSEYDQERLAHLFRRTDGIILVTGPTGGGKTTTLYAMLQAIRSPGRKILTVEDPVEYEMEGITQTQIHSKIGFTFANGLRALLRHDPDVLLVGEIRDRETAEMAIHSSLTGHLVLSSLHTTDAPGAITRLLDMGIEPYLVSSSLQAVLAQRLLRVLCTVCGGEGCDNCAGTGFFGRTAVYELLIVDDVLRTAIMNRSNADQLRSIALQQGMRPMRADGLDKISKGLTTYEELERVLGAE